MNRESVKRFRITDSNDAQHPYALLDQTGTVVAVDARPKPLATLAWDKGADEVAHDYDYRKAAERGHV